jgi:Uma2 family endonuclease
MTTFPTATPTGINPLPRMTWDEYWSWADEDTWAEWVNGEVVMMSGFTLQHQNLLLFLLLFLSAYLGERQSGNASIWAC